MEVTVQGGGLSGLATAWLAGNGSAPVTVWDRHGRPGGRFAGGWQILENFTAHQDALEEWQLLGLPSDPPLYPAHHALLVEGSGRVWEVESQRPYAYFLRRGAALGCLDRFLLGELQQKGVGWAQGSGPAPPTFCATGPRQADGVAREWVFRTSLAATVAVLFDPTLTPGGYAYLFALEGLGTFGVAMAGRPQGMTQKAHGAWEKFRQVLGPFSFEMLHRGGQFMNFFLSRDFQDSRGVFHVGEAAGVQDYLFGLGIRLGLRSAFAAWSRWAGRPWKKRWKKLQRRMQATVGMRWLFERLGPCGVSHLCRCLASGDFQLRLAGLLQREGFFRLLAKPLLPLWRNRHACGHGELCQWCRRVPR